MLILPDKFKALDRFAQGLGPLPCLWQCAALHEDAELVAVQARQGVALPDLPFQHVAQLPQQLVAGHVTAGVIDDLELVKVEIARRVRRSPRARS
jgi:hypothetical protein